MVLSIVLGMYNLLIIETYYYTNVNTVYSYRIGILLLRSIYRVPYAAVVQKLTSCLRLGC